MWIRHLLDRPRCLQQHRLHCLPARHISVCNSSKLSHVMHDLPDGHVLHRIRDDGWIHLYQLLDVRDRPVQRVQLQLFSGYRVRCLCQSSLLLHDTALLYQRWNQRANFLFLVLQSRFATITQHDIRE